MTENINEILLAIQVMSRGDNEGLPTRQELKDFMNK